MQKKQFTSESVTEGHPDKICDQISDAILDELIRQDPMSRVACETVVTTGLVLVMGEITTQGYVDIQKIARDTIREIGYDRAKYGFDADTCGVIVSINEQSPDIAMGVDKSYEIKENLAEDVDLAMIGAGDQGMMFGYATDETEEYMPFAISLAHKITYRLAQVRKEKILSYLRPYGKSQVTVEYDGDGKPVRLDTIVLSTQHDEKVSIEELRADIRKHVLDAVLPADLVDERTRFYINPTGRFVIGDRRGTAGLPEEKLLLILMAAMQGMAAAHFPERTARRLTGRPLMQPVILLKMSWRQGLRNAARYRFPMPSA